MEKIAYLLRFSCHQATVSAQINNLNSRGSGVAPPANCLYAKRFSNNMLIRNAKCRIAVSFFCAISYEQNHIGA